MKGRVLPSSKRARAPSTWREASFSSLAMSGTREERCCSDIGAAGAAGDFTNASTEDIAHDVSGVATYLTLRMKGYDRGARPRARQRHGIAGTEFLPSCSA